MDREEIPRVRTPALVLHVRGHRRIFFRTAPLVCRTTANHTAVGGGAGHLQLQHAAILERQLENLAILCSRR